MHQGEDNSADRRTEETLGFAPTPLGGTERGSGSVAHRDVSSALRFDGPLGTVTVIVIVARRGRGNDVAIRNRYATESGA
jgi:hypothetical protein